MDLTYVGLVVSRGGYFQSHCSYINPRRLVVHDVEGAGVVKNVTAVKGRRCIVASGAALRRTLSNTLCHIQGKDACQPNITAFEGHMGFSLQRGNVAPSLVWKITLRTGRLSDQGPIRLSCQRLPTSKAGR